MNKKLYITPISVVKVSHVQTYLHNFTKDSVNTAAFDVTVNDVGFNPSSSTIDINNEASDKVSFGKERGDSGPWESIW